MKVRLKRQGKLYAIITVDFGDFLINGFRIMESDRENPRGDCLWITAPSYLAAGKYHKIFFVKEEKVRGELEDVIWGEFYRELAKQEVAAQQGKDDIPF